MKINTRFVKGIWAPSGDPYWPITGVTKPLHLWPFSQTQDYTDQGSTGGLDLSAEGSGHSFGAGGLVLNGSGWATRTNHTDVCNVEATFSALIEMSWGGAASSGMVGGTNAYADYPNYGWYLLTGWGGTGIILRTINPAGEVNQIVYGPSVLTPGPRYQVVATLSAGIGTLYINGTPVASGALPTPLNMTARPFALGAVNYVGSYPVTGTIKRAAVLKGTAWSAADVAAIYAGLP
jgi:hypothetical protein